VDRPADKVTRGEVVALHLPQLSRLFRCLTTSSYLRNNMVLLIGNFLTGLCTMLAHPVLGRLMTLADYSTVGALIGVLNIVLVTPQIISTVASKYAATLSAKGNLAQVNDLIRRLTAMLLPVGLLATVGFSAGSGFIAAFLRMSSPQSVLILGLACLVLFASPVNVGVLLGLERFSWLAAISVLPGFLRLVLSSLLVLLGFGVNGAILGLVLSYVLTYLVSFQPLRDILAGARSSMGSLQPLWSYSVTAALALASSVLLSSVDTLLAKHFLVPQQAGLYFGLATTGRIVLFISSSVGLVMFPKVAALHERGKRPLGVVLQAILGVLLLSAIAECTFSVAPSFVVGRLFGPKFLAIAGQLPWYGLAMLLLALAQPFAGYFLATGNRMFVCIVASCGVLQGVLIAMRHTTVAEIVQAVIIGNAMLFTALLVAFAVHMRGDRWPGGAEAERDDGHRESCVHLRVDADA
jgi:O-antigen/teichoic acid export membrane protein